jgi:hypothetical protein
MSGLRRMELWLPAETRSEMHKRIPYGLRSQVIEELCKAVIKDTDSRPVSVVVTEILDGKWRMP